MRISDWSSDVCSSDLGIAKNGAAQEKPIDQEQSEDGGEKGQTQGALEQYAINLNERAAEGRVDPLIGRDLEVERVMQTLCRRRKNNPLLVGEAGVGQTATDEGLAGRVVDGKGQE